MKKYMLIMVVLLLVCSFANALEVSVSDYDPKPAEAGKAVNVWFNVQNPTDDQELDVYIEVVPKDELRLTTGESARKKIGIIAGRSSQTVQYRFLVNSDAFEGSHNIEVSLFKGNQVAIKRDLSIEVTEKDFKEVSLAVGDVESDPSSIKPDDEDVKLEVTIQNLGDGRAQGVKAELVDLPEGIVLSQSYSGTSLLGNIEADSVSVATFFIDISDTVKADEYDANILMSYKYKPDEAENDVIFEEEKVPLKIAIKPVPLF